MNRLVLVGNGFDLAHGLNTCYKDFIIWYIKDCFEKAHREQIHEDRLIIITKTNYVYNLADDRSRWVDQYISKIEHPKQRQPVLWSSFSDENRRPDMSPFIIKYKSKLLEPLLSRCNTSNWVDIESEYYELLKDILELKSTGTKQSQLDDLNESLCFIVSRLESYLLSLPVTPYLVGYEKIFSSDIESGDLYPKKSDRHVRPIQSYILNFNYTDTVEQYTKNMKVSKGILPPIVNYIHGKLRDIDNELIFGFGDEADAAYKKMEDDSKVKGYFDYIKSFWYLRTDNYKSLVNFLDSDDYQVYVLGHSCGLSDRTMLQMIFEHTNCRSIKIFYYKQNDTDNFVSLTHEIARHFTDKGLMRKKIKSKRGSIPMPQHDD